MKVVKHHESDRVDKPNSLFVADFIGSPSMNFIKGTISKESNSIIFKPNNESDINFDLSNYEFKRTIED